MVIIWYEIWGIEKGDSPPPVLLVKIPQATEDDAETEKAAKETAQSFIDAGATEVVIKRYGPPQS